MPHPLAVLSSPLTSSSSVGHTISNLLTYSAQATTGNNKMTKAFVLFYMVAFVASRASAFAPASTRTQSFVAHDVAKQQQQQQQQRANKPLFMSDDDVSSKCIELYIEKSLCFVTLMCPSHLSSPFRLLLTGMECPQVGHDWRGWCEQRGRTSF